MERARALRMPYEEGRARLELGRHDGLQESARRRHLLHARKIFTALETPEELSRAEAALAELQEAQAFITSSFTAPRPKGCPSSTQGR